MGDGRRCSQPAPRPGLASLSQQGIAEHALAEPPLLVDDTKAARCKEDEYAAYTHQRRLPSGGARHCEQDGNGEAAGEEKGREELCPMHARQSLRKCVAGGASVDEQHRYGREEQGHQDGQQQPGISATRAGGTVGSRGGGVYVGVACARVVGVVVAEQNAREYLHEDGDGEDARYAQNFPDRLHPCGAAGMGDGERQRRYPTPRSTCVTVVAPARGSGAIAGLRVGGRETMHDRARVRRVRARAARDSTATVRTALSLAF